jgi:hypothetical protein
MPYLAVPGRDPIDFIRTNRRKGRGRVLNLKMEGLAALSRDWHRD